MHHATSCGAETKKGCCEGGDSVEESRSAEPGASSRCSSAWAAVGGRSGGTQPWGRRQCRDTAKLARRLTCTRGKGRGEPE